LDIEVPPNAGQVFRLAGKVTATTLYASLIEAMRPFRATFGALVLGPPEAYFPGSYDSSTALDASASKP
jgi:hypothetical protein